MSNTEIDDGLTEEERAALADDDGGDTTASTTDGDAEAEAAAAQGADNEQTQEAATAAAEQSKADDTATTAEGEPEAQSQQAPILVASPVEEANARLVDIQSEKNILLDKFDNGDITAREYQTQVDALAKEERKLEFQIHEAELAGKLENQRLQNEWVSTCDKFMDDNPIYKENARLWKALDTEVRELANDPKTANWSGQKFLDEAHKNLTAAFNLPQAKSAGKDTSKKQADAKRELPPNLSKVPSAEIEDTSGGRFAVLDRLANTDPIAYEEALNKMPQAERDAYLASN